MLELFVCQQLKKIVRNKDNQRSFLVFSNLNILWKFLESNKTAHPNFCGTVEPIKDQKVAKFGLNPIS